jgi:hypothetical protein
VSDSPDFQELYRRLLDTSRKAFTSIQQQHVGENFYAFALFHEPLWGYIFPTSNSEEGLIRKAQEYQLDKYHLGYSKRSIEDLSKTLRWNPGDWAYHVPNEDDFAPVNNWLTQYDIYWRYKDDEARWDQMNAEMIVMCRNVLKTLDNEGLFGTDATRMKITLNIMMGDQDNSWIEHVRLLNPEVVYRRWVSEVQSGFDISTIS